MAKVRILGTYQPKRTPLHGLDARAKIGFAVLMTAAVFAAHSMVSFAACAVLLAVALLLARIEPLQLAVALRPAGVMLAFALLASTLVPAASADIPLGPLGISGAGMVRGARSVARIVLLVGFVLIVAATTTQTQLVDAFTRIFSPLGSFGLPVGDIAMSLSLALRFIPLATDEFSRIAAAQAARGALLGKRGAISAVKRLASVAVPLTVRLFGYADDVAIAMARRGYDGRIRGTGSPRMDAGGWLVLVLGVGAVVVAIAV